MDARHTLECDIYEFNSLRNRLYRYTTFQKWCGFSVYRLATVLEMRLNHEYWCELECTWQTNSINKTATSERPDSWASRLWRGTGIELVFKSIDCFTVRPFFFNQADYRGGMLSSFYYWCCVCVCWGGGGGAQLLLLLVLYTDLKAAEGN